MDEDVDLPSFGKKWGNENYWSQSGYKSLMLRSERSKLEYDPHKADKKVTQTYDARH